ncbi:MAG: hypothetical protein Q4G27_09295 [Flavobacteriaceae bacterium]|nr:hypothetical protein [Flavobacteriaceae bacterium]
MIKKLFPLVCLLLAFNACTTQMQQLSQNDFVELNRNFLSDQLVEISSLNYQNGIFSGINDSGGEPIIYFFTEENPEKIYHSIHLSNASNRDWEAMTMSDSLVFVGDHGNNRGNRKDLKIYYFPKSKIDFNHPNQKVITDTISFFYPEQQDYSKQTHQHDYDAEALVWLNNKLHLFTKEWKSNKTRHFTLDLVKGVQPAWLVESFDIGFLVTGAGLYKLDNDNTRLGLIGYTQDGEVFLQLFDFKNTDVKWLQNPKSRIFLGNSGDLGQVEGIAFKNENEICFSAEKLKWGEKTQNQNLTCIQLK